MRRKYRLPAWLLTVVSVWLVLSPVSARASAFYDLFTYMTRNNLAAVKSLAPRGSALNRIDRATGATPLTWACMKGVNPEIVDFLISIGADLEKIDGEGNTPLTTAAMYGNYGAARVLLDRGANAQAPDARGFPPIVVASGRNGKIEIVKLLIESGIRPEASQVRLALDRAMAFQNQAIIQYLAKMGVKPGYFSALKMVLPQ